jgi:hypothetical protein
MYRHSGCCVDAGREDQIDAGVMAVGSEADALLLAVRALSLYVVAYTLF